MAISAELEPRLSHTSGLHATPPDTPLYVGLATRAIAFAVDAALINVAAVVVALGASLILSILHLPSVLKTPLLALAGFTYIIWCISYFVSFWSATGQTPGCRIMHIRVVRADGGSLRAPWAFVRCIGLVLAALPLFAGYVLILFDSRRRGLQDYMAHTAVVEVTG